MILRGTLGKMCVSTALAMAAVAIAAVPSAADGVEHDSFSFSMDGRSFTNRPEPIFDGSVQLVPGERLVSGMWIRNDRSSKVELSVAPKLSDDESALKFKTIGQSSFRLAPQEKIWIALQVELPQDSGNYSADRTERLQLQVRSSELAAEDEVNTPTPDHLPNTGLGMWPMFIGVTLVTAGVFIRKIMDRRNSDSRNKEGSKQ